MKTAAVIVLALAAVRCDLPKPPPPASFEIRVTVDGQPAKVPIGVSNHELQSKTPGIVEPEEHYRGNTDERGVWRIEPIAPAKYTVGVTAYQLTNQFGDCRTASAEFTLDPTLTFTRPIEISRNERVALTLEVTCPMRELASEAPRYDTIAKQELVEGRAEGRIAIMNGKSIDRLTSKLPDDIRAQRSDDVRTVVVIGSRSVRQGYYVGGGPAMQSIYTVTLIDRARGVPIGRRTFSTDAPGSVTTRGGHPAVGHGKRPDEEIIAWLSERVRASK